MMLHQLGPHNEALLVDEKGQQAARYKVGTDRVDYPQVRNFLSLHMKNYVFDQVPARNLFAFLRTRPVRRLLGRHHKVLWNVYYEGRRCSHDLMHFFNTVSLGSTPWVVTYEGILPHWGWASGVGIRPAMRALAGKHCKKLIAISRHAYEMQCEVFLERHREYREDIVHKTCILHPPQRLIVEDYGAKMLPDDAIVFTLVGSQFFRKGGRETLQVFADLLHKGWPLRLNVISDLNIGGYNVSRVTEEDVREVHRIMERYQAQIRHFVRLSNPEVLQILRRSHVGLLPTYHDTYGYSVLEAQACGCPVITTDVVALTEINDEKVGWVIETPKDGLRIGRYGSSAERAKFSQAIKDGLYRALETIVACPEYIQEKAMAAVQRIKALHDPLIRARELEQIYDAGLAGDR